MVPNPNRPPVPTPEASPQEVHEFLVESTLALSADTDPEVASAKVEHIIGDGIALYEYSAAFWYEKLGFQGLRIYHALQTSRYGFVSLLQLPHHILK